MESDEIECFTRRFNAMEVTFPDTAETWVLTKKLSDTACQYTQSDFELLGGPSGAYGTFECHRAGNPSDTAIMKIFMQVPHGGSGGQTQSEMAGQASEKLDYYARSALEGYKQLKQAGCTSTPRLMGYKIDRQGRDELVPGGYMVYMLLGKVPGVQLDTVYWSMSPEVREKIRGLFRVALEDCLNCGVHIVDTNMANLVWDGDNDKM
ncbi:hypothetical protein MW887_003545 [Aspergillus wentii]|nr:hypothetical protein MW887_003545 [Aspergillus wentii]